MASCGTIVVESAFEEDNVSASCSVRDETITEGDSARVDVDITNDNDNDADVTLDLLIDDETVDTIETSVDGGSSTTQEFDVTDLSEGEHTVDVETTASEA